MAVRARTLGLATLVILTSAYFWYDWSEIGARPCEQCDSPDRRSRAAPLGATVVGSMEGSKEEVRKAKGAVVARVRDTSCELTRQVDVGTGELFFWYPHSVSFHSTQYSTFSAGFNRWRRLSSRVSPVGVAAFLSGSKRLGVVVKPTSSVRRRMSKDDLMMYEELTSLQAPGHNGISPFYISGIGVPYQLAALGADKVGQFAEKDAYVRKFGCSLNQLGVMPWTVSYSGSRACLKAMEATREEDARMDRDLKPEDDRPVRWIVKKAKSQGGKNIELFQSTLDMQRICGSSGQEAALAGADGAASGSPPVVAAAIAAEVGDMVGEQDGEDEDDDNNASVGAGGQGQASRGTDEGSTSGRAAPLFDLAVIQKYLPRPFLIDGRKFDMRHHLLVASTSPLMVFLIPGYLRLALRKYQGSGPAVKGQHITNRHFQMDDSDEPSSGHVVDDSDDGDQPEQPKIRFDLNQAQWPMDRLKKLLEETYADTLAKNSDVVADILEPQWLEISRLSILADRHRFDRAPGRFHLYGLDFLFDEDLKVTLIEGNGNPGRANGGVRRPSEAWKTKLNQATWNGGFELVRDIQELRRPELASVEAGDIVVSGGGNFRVVFNELTDRSVENKCLGNNGSQPISNPCTLDLRPGKGSFKVTGKVWRKT